MHANYFNQKLSTLNERWCPNYIWIAFSFEHKRSCCVPELSWDLPFAVLHDSMEKKKKKNAWLENSLTGGGVNWWHFIPFQIRKAFPFIAKPVTFLTASNNISSGVLFNSWTTWCMLFPFGKCMWLFGWLVLKPACLSNAIALTSYTQKENQKEITTNRVSNVLNEKTINDLPSKNYNLDIHKDN